MSEIRRQLESFEVSSKEDQLSFLDRLARENQWPKGFTERVYREYLRFIYLAAASDHPVTPSEQVDQAWHLHLCYSKSYWQDLCADVLGFELHHNPTVGGREERAKLLHQYQSTLESYQQVFGDPPPEDIWPRAEVRFDRSDRFARVSLRDSYVIPKRWTHLAALAIASLLILSGCQMEGLASGFKKIISSVWDHLSFVTILIVVVLLIACTIRGKGRGGGGCGSSCGSGCGGGCGGGD